MSEAGELDREEYK
jgi:hypothetical protein